MAVQIQLRRGTSGEWLAADPILAVAEVGIETDTNQFKVGNGVDQWSVLTYGGIAGPTGPTGPTGVVTASGTGLSYDSGTQTITLDPSSLAADSAFTTAFAPLLLTETTERTANYTLALTDQGKVVPMNGTDLEVTVPTNANVAFPIGSVVNIYNRNATGVEIKGDSGVDVRNDGDLAQYGEVSLRKRATDEWVVAGNLS